MQLEFTRTVPSNRTGCRLWQRYIVAGSDLPTSFQQQEAIHYCSRDTNTRARSTMPRACTCSANTMGSGFPEGTVRLLIVHVVFSVSPNCIRTHAPRAPQYVANLQPSAGVI